MTEFLSQATVVFGKELKDALRDRRTLLKLLVPNLLIGPLMLLAIVALIAWADGHAKRRDVYIDGAEYGPTLTDFFRREGYTVRPAPKDYEDRLRFHALHDVVLILPKAFEVKLAAGIPIAVDLVGDDISEMSNYDLMPMRGMLENFNRERARLQFAARGISSGFLEPLAIREGNSSNSRSSKLTVMIPFFVMLALFTGALTAALDSTAGERERGSLEPLLMNPLRTYAVVAGKWAAVTLMSIVSCLISSLSFVVAQVLFSNTDLRELFHFDWRDALEFWLLQIPLAATISATLMALAIRAKTYKEAQATTSLAWTCFSLILMIPIFDREANASWHQFVPGLSQGDQMKQVLLGEHVSMSQVSVGAAMCLSVTAMALAFVTKSIRLTLAR